MCFNAWSTVNEIIRRHGLVGGSVLLWGVRFEVSYVLKPSVVHNLLLLSVDQDVELSAPSLALCLSACCHASYHDGKGLNL